MRRAAGMAISANGTTFLGLIPAVLITLFLLLQAFRLGGWAGIRTYWLQNVYSTFVILALWWFACFIYQLFFMPSEEFSAQQIADYAQGVVLEVTSEDISPVPIKSGFWIDRGYMITCGATAESRMRTELVGIIMPQSIGTSATWGGGAFMRSAETVYLDAETGIQILNVRLDPFHHGAYRLVITPHDGINPDEFMDEKFWVPEIETRTVAVGSIIFMTPVEPMGKVPVVPTIEGQITRIGVNLDVATHPIRIYTSLPFKSCYIGAPVMSASKRVIGIVSGASGDTSVLVPSKYILDCLKDFHKRPKPP